MIRQSSRFFLELLKKIHCYFVLVWRSLRKIIYYLLKWREDFPSPLCRQGCLSYTGATPFLFFPIAEFGPLPPLQTIQQQHFPPGLEGWIKLYISHFLTVLAFLPEKEEKPYKVSFGSNPKTSAAAGGDRSGCAGAQQPPGPFLGRERCWIPEEAWLGSTCRLLKLEKFEATKQ